MDALIKKVDKAVKLVQDKGYGYAEAIEKVRYGIDGDEFYDMETGEIISDIDHATEEQMRILLQIEKNPWQRVQ
ncbi:hypothetical protein [Clostridium sp.]|uniref:hypothetical protein n=1 Tax=Clostridium sp. TaxID=1506 RepID=UPI00359F26FE